MVTLNLCSDRINLGCSKHRISGACSPYSALVAVFSLLPNESFELVVPEWWSCLSVHAVEQPKRLP